MQLNLKETLEKNSRCLVRRVLPNTMEDARSKGFWALSTIGEDRKVWERLFIGDHIIIWDYANFEFHLLAAIVSGKSLDLNIPKAERPLRLTLELKGTKTTNKIPLYGYNSRIDLFCPKGEFKELWEICDKTSEVKLEKVHRHFYEWDDFFIRVASSQSDLDYIETFATTHSFGYRKAFITLIAYKDNKLLGAILAEPTFVVKYPHAASIKLFGSNYDFLRFDSLSIVRIFASSEVSNKLHVHEALLRGLIEVAPFLVDRPIALIEGVSYDYHPIAEKVGFNVELPETPTESIYYWKPFNLPKEYIESLTSTQQETKQAVHALIKLRNNLQFFGVYGTMQNIARSVRERAWALKKIPKNRGLWKSLRRGDIIFFISNRQLLEGYAIVETTSYDKNLYPYPLRIDLSYYDVPFMSLDLTIEPISSWIELPHSCGIFNLRTRIGSQLKEIIDRRQSEDKMWVKPNAYLLPGTEFVQIPKQIFVIQAWSLKDSVLPTIRDIFISKGYSVTHADDREGQIIFGDIWKLMNEAQVVLVDFTEKRPNVYLEYGMALVLGKPIIAISQNLTDLPSDTPQLKTIIYENSIAGTRILADKLLRAVVDRIDDVSRTSAT